MAGKDTKTTSKWFRIGTEGATTDGRTIERAWLEQMATSYNPATYGARINLEHIDGIDPTSIFKRYGDVLALKTEEIEINGEKRLTLLAQIEPTADLVALSKARQKIYTSMEVSADFAKTGKAYLVGLAVTDNPASLGTEMLQFAAKAATNPFAGRKHAPGNLFTAAEEATLEFVETPLEPSLADKIKAMFAKREKADDAKHADVTDAIEVVAEQLTALTARVDTLAGAQAAGADLTALRGELKALADKFDTTAAPGAKRSPAAGGNSNGTLTTDC